MSSFRANGGSVSATDAKRIAKQEQESRKFTKVAAYVKPDVPMTKVDTAEPSAQEQANDNVLEFLHTKERKDVFIDMFRDYSDYQGFGFNGEVQQELSYSVKVSTPDGKTTTKWFSRFLGAQDGPDTGLVFNEVPRQKNGFATENPDSTPEVNPEPIGRWTLKRAPREECAVTRTRTDCWAEINGEMELVKQGIVFNSKTPKAYCLAIDYDPTTLEYPGTRYPVVVERHLETEAAQIVEMGGKHYAYRNLLGVLEIADMNGKVGVSHPVVNYEPSTIEANREVHAKKVAAWSAMSAAERKDRRFKPGIKKIRPNVVKSECHLLNHDGAGRDPYLIEVKQDDEGRWHQVRTAEFAS